MMVQAPASPAHPQAPDFAPIVRAWRKTGICYVCLGLAILLFGCALLLFTMYEAKPSEFSQITKIAAGLVTITSLQLFNLGRKRFERIGIVETLRLRWISLASSDGSERQIAELNRMVTKMLRDNLARGL